MISRSCFRTSCSLLSEVTWMKFSKHHGPKKPFAFHASYTVSRVI
uniref:Uncharacterized protein n=1 Tax=Arundo donax TaxID=35708 RepID=A0A0A9DX77_ARUDO